MELLLSHQDEATKKSNSQFWNNAFVAKRVGLSLKPGQETISLAEGYIRNLKLVLKIGQLNFVSPLYWDENKKFLRALHPKKHKFRVLLFYLMTLVYSLKTLGLVISTIIVEPQTQAADSYERGLSILYAHAYFMIAFGGIGFHLNKKEGCEAVNSLLNFDRVNFPQGMYVAL